MGQFFLREKSSEPRKQEESLLLPSFGSPPIPEGEGFFLGIRGAIGRFKVLNAELPFHSPLAKTGQNRSKQVKTYGCDLLKTWGEIRSKHVTSENGESPSASSGEC